MLSLWVLSQFLTLICEQRLCHFISVIVLDQTRCGRRSLMRSHHHQNYDSKSASQSGAIATVSRYFSASKVFELHDFSKDYGQDEVQLWLTRYLQFRGQHSPDLVIDVQQFSGVSAFVPTLLTDPLSASMTIPAIQHPCQFALAVTVISAIRRFSSSGFGSLDLRSWPYLSCFVEFVCFSYFSAE